MGFLGRTCRWDHKTLIVIVSSNDRGIYYILIYCSPTPPPVPPPFLPISLLIFPPYDAFEVLCIFWIFIDLFCFCLLCSALASPSLPSPSFPCAPPSLPPLLPLFLHSSPSLSLCLSHSLFGVINILITCPSRIGFSCCCFIFYAILAFVLLCLFVAVLLFVVAVAVAL